MRKTIWAALALIMLVSAGIGFAAGRQYSLSSYGFASHDGTTLSTPAWIVEDMSGRVAEDVRQLVTRDGIKLIPIGNQKETAQAQSELPPDLLASINLPDGQGLVVVYERKGSHYQAAFSKAESVYSYQLVADNQLVLTTNSPSADVDERTYHILHKTPEGYREVWNGLAHRQLRQKQRENHEVLDASVFLDAAQKSMIYFSLERSLDLTGVPIMEKSSYQLWRYNERTLRYEK
ncbi:hypothetical protein NDK47_12420 [Brevibacillus ruminantium]|uniref:Uncharacterized protein n=1 Tax=Brevibacillus ruminantium TaxID=2950604 RepID=A0ABY4WLW3_9BACL|nr:hypothetical protein [Brevibacillus ruminantium]USG68028.1 hypothetical protein NDK47_12420 [Brevibacillus ruminantium]